MKMFYFCNSCGKLLIPCLNRFVMDPPNKEGNRKIYCQKCHHEYITRNHLQMLEMEKIIKSYCINDNKTNYKQERSI